MVRHCLWLCTLIVSYLAKDVNFLKSKCSISEDISMIPYLFWFEDNQGSIQQTFKFTLIFNTSYTKNYLVTSEGVGNKMDILSINFIRHIQIGI